MTEHQPIQWFPGHMAKTMKEIRQTLSQVDIIIECIDARAPDAFQHDFFNEFKATKKHLLVLTKTDCANADKTNQWIQENKQFHTIFPVAIPIRKGIKTLLNYCAKFAETKKAKKRFHITKVMVIGFPNVGKSALINCLANKKATKVENRPGLTRKLQWVMIGTHLSLLDTPGILTPKIDNQEEATKLALLKCIKESHSDPIQICRWLIQQCMAQDPTIIENRFQIKCYNQVEDEVIETIAKKRQYILPDGDIDTIRTAKSIIEEYRSGKIGKISLF